MRSLSKKKKIMIAVGIFVLALILINSLKKEEGSFTEEVVKTQDITTYYSFEGNIDSDESQNVVSKSNLSIKKFHVSEGDMVNVGDLLFELDDSNIKSNLEQAKASVELAKINLDMAMGSSKDQQLSQSLLNLNTSKINYDSATSTSKEQQTLQINQALESAKSSYDSASSNLERMKKLYEIGGVAKIDLDQSQTAYNNSKMQFDIAQNNFNNMEKTINQNVSLAKEQYAAAQKSYNALQEGLGHNIKVAQEQLTQAQASYDLMLKQAEDMNILAEANGEISEIHVSENESLIMGTPIMNIVNYDDLVVTLKVDEYDLGAISLGKEADVYVNSLDMQIKGKVSDISRQALVASGISYFETSISLDSDENLRVGLSSDVRIINETAKDATTISMKVIQFDNENKPYIYYRDSFGNVATKSVDVGINDGIVVQILDGVQSGDTILVPVEQMRYPMGPPVE